MRAFRFLQRQREPEQPGYLAGLDKKAEAKRLACLLSAIPSTFSESAEFLLIQQHDDTFSNSD